MSSFDTSRQGDRCELHTQASYIPIAAFKQHGYYVKGMRVSLLPQTPGRLSVRLHPWALLQRLRFLLRQRRPRVRLLGRRAHAHRPRAAALRSFGRRRSMQAAVKVAWARAKQSSILKAGHVRSPHSRVEERQLRGSPTSCRKFWATGWPGGGLSLQSRWTMMERRPLLPRLRHRRLKGTQQQACRLIVHCSLRLRKALVMLW